ncbi:hypothetical protein HF1_06930 [Mycoplasma haemofelis str. Langford 1]|nr:hypothetical protein [Mycoplasma haemofelis]CBY92701.1 hypothetical protein HF1_06930 [Mycoplasma haemofelis str. Langford 1]
MKKLSSKEKQLYRGGTSIIGVISGLSAISYSVSLILQSIEELIPHKKFSKPTPIQEAKPNFINPTNGQENIIFS